MTETTSATGCYRVKREGGKGWHWVAPDRYDPKVDVLVDPLDHDADGKKGGSVPAEPSPVEGAPAPTPAPKPKRTRRKKAG